MPCKRLTKEEYDNLPDPKPQGLEEDLCNDGCRFNCGNSSCAGDEECVGYVYNNNYQCIPRCPDGYLPFWADPWGTDSISDENVHYLIGGSSAVVCLPTALDITPVPGTYNGVTIDENHPAKGTYCLNPEVGTITPGFLGTSNAAFYFYTQATTGLHSIIYVRSGFVGGATGRWDLRGSGNSFVCGNSTFVNFIPDFSACGFDVQIRTSGCRQTLECQQEFYPDNYESPCPEGFDGGGGWCYKAPTTVSSCEECPSGYDPALQGYLSGNCYPGAYQPG